MSDASVPEPRDPSPSPEESAADRELADAVNRALDTLPEVYREVILLRDVEGLTAPDAAESLGVSVDAVKSRLHRAREALRNALSPLLESAAPKPSSSCPHVALLWSRKLEGDLSQKDCAAMEKHLATCPACEAACGALKRALLACGRSRTPEVSPHLQLQVKAAVREWTTRAARRRGGA